VVSYFLRYFSSTSTEQISGFRRTFHQFRSGWLCYFCYSRAGRARTGQTLAWQNEIESALYSMDALAALMTKDFHDSEWTDQEVGFALGRHVPTIPVRLGRNPYGFLGRIQALSSNWDNAAEEIVTLMIKYDGMLDAYLQAIRECGSYDNANLLARILPGIEELEDDQIAALVDAHNSNDQVHGSYGFNGERRNTYGSGLLPHLHRLGTRRYETSGAPFHHIRLASVNTTKKKSHS
jgi:hypothetical protein